MKFYSATVVWEKLIEIYVEKFHASIINGEIMLIRACNIHFVGDVKSHPVYVKFLICLNYFNYKGSTFCGNLDN